MDHLTEGEKVKHIELSQQAIEIAQPFCPTTVDPEEKRTGKKTQSKVASRIERKQNNK